MLLMILIGLDVIEPLACRRCKFVFHDFILSEVNRTVVGHTL